MEGGAAAEERVAVILVVPVQGGLPKTLLMSLILPVGIAFGPRRFYWDDAAYKQFCDTHKLTIALASESLLPITSSVLFPQD